MVQYKMSVKIINFNFLFFLVLFVCTFIVFNSVLHDLGEIVCVESEQYELSVHFVWKQLPSVQK